MCRRFKRSAVAFRCLCDLQKLHICGSWQPAACVACTAPAPSSMPKAVHLQCLQHCARLAACELTITTALPAAKVHITAACRTPSQRLATHAAGCLRAASC